MSEIEVKIVTLEPARMISAYGYGPEPETMAWDKLMAFAVEKNVYDKDKPRSTFGFNNPNPCHGSPNYGYEIWLPVDKSVEPEGDLRIVDFNGGMYGVTNFKNLNKIGETWQKLAQWREASKYRAGHHQWLEELLTPPGTPLEEYVFNLYLPIVE